MSNADRQAEQTARRAVLKVEAERKASNFTALFTSPIGASVLAEIKEEFDAITLCADTAHETTIKAAQRDVVRWIETVIARGQGL